MTIDLDAIRARDAATVLTQHGVVLDGHESFYQVVVDRRDLLAEVDRLTVLLGAAACAPCEGDAERARALPVIEAARALCMDGGWSELDALRQALRAYQDALAEYDEHGAYWSREDV